MQNNIKIKKPWYKRWYMIVVYVIVGLTILGSLGSKNSKDSNTTSTSSSSDTKSSNTNTKTENKTNTNTNTNNNTNTNTTANEEVKKEDNVPTEYKSALNKAKTYSDTMYMSKQGIYNQLTSEYGEKFSAQAAQYAIDNLQVDYKQNALKKAQDYQSQMSMSPSAIYDQLTSEYGEKFTAEEAQYAIDNLK